MVGEKIKKRRKQLGWTQEDLMKKMGYTNISTISKIESNVNDVNQSTLKKFAEVLGVEPTYFFFNEVEEKQDELFEKSKVLFDLSKKCNPEDLDAIIKIVERMVDEEQ